MGLRTDTDASVKYPIQQYGRVKMTSEVLFRSNHNYSTEVVHLSSLLHHEILICLPSWKQ